MKQLLVLIFLIGSGPAFGKCDADEHPYFGTTVQPRGAITWGNFVLGSELWIWPTYHGGSSQYYRLNVTRNAKEWLWIKNERGTLGHVVIDGDRIELPFTAVKDTDVRTTGFSTARVIVKERIHTRIDEDVLRRMGDKSADVYIWVGGYKVELKKGDKKLIRNLFTHEKCVAAVDKAMQEVMHATGTSN